MKALSDYGRSEFARQAFIVSWLLAILPAAAMAIYMMTHPTRDSTATLVFILLLIYCGSAIVVNLAALIYWLGDRLPGGVPRLATILWPVAFLGSLWFFISKYVVDYVIPVVLSTLGLMALFIVAVRLTLWVVDGFRENPAAVDHDRE